jgi:hypothetical protein
MARIEHRPISNVARTPSLHPRLLDRPRVHEIGAELLDVGDGQVE